MPRINKIIMTIENQLCFKYPPRVEILKSCPVGQLKNELILLVNSIYFC
jgi:hypothetical protein